MSTLPALLVNLDQRTPEWFAWRRSHRMASESVALMGCAPKWMPVRTPLGLFNLKARDIEPPRSAYLEYAAERGHRLEPRAMAKVEALLGVPMGPCVIARGDYGASPDGGDYGFVVDDEPLRVEQIAEVKAPMRGLNSKRGASIIDGELTPYDEVQVQHQLMVSGARVCHFGVFDEREDALRSLPVTSDTHMHQRLRDAWDQFWPHIEANEPPPPGLDDVIERDDAKWADAGRVWRIAKAQLDAAEAAEAAARKTLRELAGDITSTGHRVRATFYWDKGRIPYSNLPEVQALELEGRRGKGSLRMKVTEVKA